jgi:hypothetical protein
MFGDTYVGNTSVVPKLFAMERGAPKYQPWKKGRPAICVKTMPAICVKTEYFSVHMQATRSLTIVTVQQFLSLHLVAIHSKPGTAKRPTGPATRMLAEVCSRQSSPTIGYNQENLRAG